MPKITNTRKHKARELMRLAALGPALFNTKNPQETITQEKFHSFYKLWSETWILPALKKLVPELKPKPDALKEGGGS